ncbi:class I SAM-dependent methyltransferase [Actinocorallia sp. B10E7]|uniref:class I SAM-dependent methyltransferase n=1 Tax=Actinocorallia sp. B10E7 TaxID=3153558 RepID=UPI00325D1AD1
MAHHTHHHHASDDETGMAELLDLDAEVLHPLLTEMTALLEELAGDTPPRRILDLGSGTGAGTLALLQRFGEAEAVAVDASESMLLRLHEKARELGLADRIHTVQADLDDEWPPLDTVDLVWASASLHHLADPDRGLREIFAALRPGGLLAVLELDSFPRFLPEDLGFGRPGFEERCHAALAEQRGHDLPDLGSDWGPRLSRAGFAVKVERVFDVELTPPLPAAAGRYAEATLRRGGARLRGLLSPDDQAVLDALLDEGGPHHVLRRTDLTVRATRTAWVAGRP